VSFNIPGPDLSATAFAESLELLEGRPLAVVNTTSTSGDFLSKLSAPGRIVITSTANSSENQHSHFAGFFTEALAGTAADADKDKSVSLLEAFVFAKRETARFFESEKRLLTEHAMLDDNGDGKGSLEIDNESEDGKVAARFVLASQTLNADDPNGAERLRLNVAARKLVSRVEQLKRNKNTMLEKEYLLELEAVLTDLAKNRRAFRATPGATQ